MKTNPTNRMKDPFFAQLMFLIEQLICKVDQEAAGKGIVLKDSQIMSALTKARGLFEGKQPKISDATELDLIIKKLILSIHGVQNEIMEQYLDEENVEHNVPVRTQDWLGAIETVMDSLSTRRSEIPGSRHYLDFVQDFIAEALQKQRKDEN